MAYSRQRAVSDGTLQRLDVAIRYIRRADINVLLDGVVTDQWAWAGNSDAVQFPSPVPNGVEVTLVRTTQSDRVIHEFAKGAKFVNTSVDQDFTQMLYLAQEYIEGGGQVEFFTDIDMHGYRIKNLGAALSPSDAAQLAQTLVGYTYGQVFYHTGTGTQVAFQQPVTRSNMLVSVGGVKQMRSTYSEQGGVLTFSEAPPRGVPIEVIV